MASSARGQILRLDRPWPIVLRFAVAIVRCLEEEAAPMPRAAFPSFAVALLPALLAAGCNDAPAAQVPPLPQAALAAVVEHPGVNREKLARAVDAVFTGDGIGETRAVVVMHG